MHTPTKKELADAEILLADKNKQLQELPLMGHEWKIAAGEKGDIEGWLRVAQERGQTRLPLLDALAAH